MAEIVKGLFGIDPQGYQENALAQKRAEAIQYAKLDPFQKASVGIYQGVQQGVDAGLGMMGVQDPGLQAQQIASKLATQYDMNDPASLQEFQKALQEQAQTTGNGQLSEFASMVGNKLMGLRKMSLEEQKTLSEIQKNQMGNLTETQKTQQQIAFLQRNGDPDNMLPGLEARLRTLVRSDMPASIQTQIIVPQMEKYNNAKANQDAIAPLVANIDTGILKFGPTENFRNMLTRISGESDEGSRAAAEFQSTLETIRLQAQILQKGSQTDRDAANIMNSFLSGIDKMDTKTVRAQLMRINGLMAKSAENAMGIVKHYEDYYGGADLGGKKAPTFSGQATAGQPQPPKAGAQPPVAPVVAASGKQIYITPQRLQKVRSSDPKYANMTDADLIDEIKKNY